MSETFSKKVEAIQKIFQDLNAESRYKAMIEMGRKLTLLPPTQKIFANIVPGCQSILYLYSELREGKIYFHAFSEALISAGMAAILVQAYSGETPETILKISPDFLKTIGIEGSLTPNRSHGLYHIHLRMKQDALKFLVK
ncbi:MAG: SufE family protein [Chlamydiia bacterium]|nr:SufE family protein [Chlamydiia bacterium]